LIIKFKFLAVNTLLGNGKDPEHCWLLARYAVSWCIGDGYACMDVNECATWGACSQLCVNTVGGHKCDCAPGYVMINNSCMVTGHRACICLLFKGTVSRDGFGL
jgi:hypothetical protein